MDERPQNGGPNHFVRGGFSRDLRHARLTVTLRGVGFQPRGAALKLLVQGSVAGRSLYMLHV